MDSAVQKKFDEARKLIGNTPMAEITYRYKKGQERKKMMGACGAKM